MEPYINKNNVSGITYKSELIPHHFQYSVAKHESGGGLIRPAKGGAH
jgi:hypothetical protein